MEPDRILFRIRIFLIFFTAALIISGATAIPLRWELSILQRIFGSGTYFGEMIPSLSEWLSIVHKALVDISKEYPFLAYGFDWLAFGHFVIAISMLGALHDPIRNKWVIEYAMIACVLLVPYAMVMGGVRGIPFGWRIIDSMFGIVGLIPLFVARRLTMSLDPRS